MAAGKPVAVSDVPPLRRVVSEADAGVVARAGDPDSFADALTELGTVPDRRDRLGRNGRRAVADRFNWARDAERLRDVYDSLA